MSFPIKYAVIISDIHAGCGLAICPIDGCPLDDGGTYRPSEVQADWLWPKWLAWWNEWVPKWTEDQPWVLVVNGDAVDGVHHESVTQFTHNLERQEACAVMLLESVIRARACQAAYFVRGTEAHGGKSGQSEERVARSLAERTHKVVGTAHGIYSRWHLKMRLGFGLIDIAHHIGTTGSMAYETSAVQKELEQLFVNAARWEKEVPDCIVRCLSEDTEILTRGGWKGMNDVNVGDEVMTFHTFKNVLEWQRATDKVVNVNEPEMVHITGKGVDILVTPDHTMVGRTWSTRWGAQGWRPYTAGEMCDSLQKKSSNGACLQIPVAGRYEGTPVDLSLEQLWLMGFFMADGSFVRHQDRKIYSARVHQADIRSAEVESALRAAGIDDFTVCRNGQGGDAHFDSRHARLVFTRQNCSTWYIPSKHIGVFTSSLNDDKSLRSNLMEMTREQFMALLAGFDYGDGSSGPTITRLHNTNERILDQFQELFVKHGCKSNLRYCQVYTTKRGVKHRVGTLNYLLDCDAIGINQKGKTDGISRVPYTGKSWCVSVPNGTIVIRRNGCVSIVGNSHRHQNIETGLRIRKNGQGRRASGFVTAGWQLKTPFAHRTAGARVTLPQVGGSVVICGDEEVYGRHQVWDIDTDPVEEPVIEVGDPEV